MQRFSFPLCVAFLLGIATVTSASAQSAYPENLLRQKTSFMRQGAEALAQPFRGVATSAGIEAGLFELKRTGASTDAVRRAADAFLASLTPADLSRVHYAVDDPEWRNWSNVDIGIFGRMGLSLEEMNDAQKAAAWALLEVSLSDEGMEQTRNIMRTEI
ncbi:MAG: DUF3500 domain-containing protein, partial [Gammaproteobacteria bacterium]